VDSIFDEALHRCHEFTGEEGDRSGSISDFGVLGFSDVDKSLCSWMDDVEELENRRSVVGYMSLKSKLDEIEKLELPLIWRR
jgi:hypothetical protein